MSETKIETKYVVLYESNPAYGGDNCEFKIVPESDYEEERTGNWCFGGIIEKYQISDEIEKMKENGYRPGKISLRSAK